MYSVGGGCETGDSHIDTDLPTGGWQRIDRDIVARQDQHPAPTLAADLDRLDPAENLPVRADLHLPDPPQVHPVCVGMPASAVAVFGPLHTVEPSAALKSRIPWCRTGFHTSEEPVERAIQSAQRGLLARKRPYGHIRTVSPNVLELIGLGAVGDGSAAMPPGISAFLQCRVVQLPMRFQTRRQCDMLTCRRPHPKLVGSPHADTASHRARRTVGSDAYHIRPSKYECDHVFLTANNSTNATRLIATWLPQLRPHCFRQRTTRRPCAVSPSAERRKRKPGMPEHYETPPTSPTSTLWSTALIFLMAPAPVPSEGNDGSGMG